MKVVVGTIFLLVGSVFPASALTLDAMVPYLSAQRFEWREFDGGRRLLRETGWLYAAGFTQSFRHSWLTLTPRGELFGGVVDYDGETQGPTPIPVTTDVTYLGFKGEVDLGAAIPLGAVTLEPLLGVGYRWWARDIHDSRSGAATVNGYTERWDTGYLRAGARSRIPFAPEGSLFIEGGIKSPFYVANKVKIAEVGEVSVHPEGRVAGFAEAGVVYRRFLLAVSYEGTRYAESPRVNVRTSSSTIAIFQPASRSELIGIRLGYAFR